MSYDLTDCLASIDPATLDYTEWVHTGMALHAEGYPWQAWDEWSRRDSRRYTQESASASSRRSGQAET